MTAYRASYRVTAPIDDYFSNAPATTTHDFVDADDHYQHSEDTGTPTVGIYATDGIWDEEDSLGSTARYSSSMSAAPSSIKTGKGSMKSRSRSGTASPFVQDEEKAGIWGWAKRGRDYPLPERSPEAPKGLTKKESKAKLRGKGRRGELLVVVSPDENVSVLVYLLEFRLILRLLPLLLFRRLPNPISRHPLPPLPPSSALHSTSPSTTRTTRQQPRRRGRGSEGCSGCSGQSRRQRSGRYPMLPTHHLYLRSPPSSLSRNTRSGSPSPRPHRPAR